MLKPNENPYIPVCPNNNIREKYTTTRHLMTKINISFCVCNFYILATRQETRGSPKSIIPTHIIKPWT